MAFFSEKEQLKKFEEDDLAQAYLERSSRLFERSF